jgi:hypothetical protein
MHASLPFFIPINLVSRFTRGQRDSPSGRHHISRAVFGFRQPKRSSQLAMNRGGGKLFLLLMGAIVVYHNNEGVITHNTVFILKVVS